MTTQQIVSAAAIVLLSSTLGTSVSAQSMEVSGTVAMVQVWNERTELPDGRTIQRSHSKGLLRTDDSNSPWDLSTQDCRATTTLAADGNLTAEVNFCDVVDADGDMWWLTGEIGGTWEIHGGTGKYEGIEGGGAVQPEALHPDGRYSVRFQGSYQVP